MRLIKLTAIDINHHTGEWETSSPLYLNTDAVAVIHANGDGTTFIATIGCGVYSVEEDVKTILRLMSGDCVIHDREDPPPPYLTGFKGRATDDPFRTYEAEKMDAEHDRIDRIRASDKSGKKPEKVSLRLDPKAFARTIYKLTHKGPDGPEEPEDYTNE